MGLAFVMSISQPGILFFHSLPLHRARDSTIGLLVKQRFIEPCHELRKVLQKREKLSAEIPRP